MCQGRIYNSIDIKWDYLLLRAIVHDLPLLGVEGRMKTLELEQVGYLIDTRHYDESSFPNLSLSAL